MNKQTPAEIFQEILDNDLLEDRYEYDVAQLMSSYPDLTLTEATNLFNVIQFECWAKPISEETSILNTTIEEALIAGLEGWDVEERFTIKCFLFDMQLACEEVHRNKNYMP